MLTRLLTRQSLTIVLALSIFLAHSGNAEPVGHLILGDLDDENPLLLMPRQVEEGPDGNFYVLDTGDSTVKVYSPSGEFLRSMGGSGEGPGEFQRIDGATFGFTPDDLLYFTEYFGGHRWLTFLHLDGTLQRTLSPQLDTAFGIQKVAALLDGRFLVQVDLDTKVRAVGDVFYYTLPQTLTIMDEKGVLGPEIVRAEHIKLISTSPNGGTTTLPFTPRFCWLLDQAGNLVWSEGLSPHFRIFDLRGNEMPGLQTPLPESAEVTSDELASWKKSREEMAREQYPVWWERFGRAIESYDKPLYPKPVLTRLTLTPANNLLIEGRSIHNKPGVQYWLLDRQGNLLRTVTVPVFELHLSAHYLLFFTQDDEGLTLVHALAREPDEADSLVRLNDLWAEPGSITD